AYRETVVHVNDASRAVTVASNLLNEKTKGEYCRSIREEYDKLREGFLNRSKVKEYLSIADARKNKLQLNWADYQPVKPKKTGINNVEVALEELLEYIDWTPFFRTWELHGKYPEILTDPVVGEQATLLFEDARK